MLEYCFRNTQKDVVEDTVDRLPTNVLAVGMAAC